MVADQRHLHRWGRYTDAIARWEHITGFEAPSPALLQESGAPRPAPAFLEWLMGLERGWVTDLTCDLTANQQMTALGNGVLPLQAAAALGALLRQWEYLKATSPSQPSRSDGPESATAFVDRHSTAPSNRSQSSDAAVCYHVGHGNN